MKSCEYQSVLWYWVLWHWAISTSHFWGLSQLWFATCTYLTFNTGFSKNKWLFVFFFFFKFIGNINLPNGRKNRAQSDTYLLIFTSPTSIAKKSSLSFLYLFHKSFRCSSSWVFCSYKVFHLREDFSLAKQAYLYILFLYLFIYLFIFKIYLSRLFYFYLVLLVSQL